MQQKSKAQAARKKAYVMDVAEEAVQHWMHDYPARVLIHGHTHRPAKHLYDNGYIRWVLPDWSNGVGGYLFVDNTGITMRTLDDQLFPSI